MRIYSWQALWLRFWSEDMIQNLIKPMKKKSNQINQNRNFNLQGFFYLLVSLLFISSFRETIIVKKNTFPQETCQNNIYSE